MADPVLVQRTAEMVHVLKLGKRSATDAYAVPDAVYTHVGDITRLIETAMDSHRRKRRVVSWFAFTRAEQRLGPFASEPKAVAGLLASLNLVQVKGTDTMKGEVTEMNYEDMRVVALDRAVQEHGDTPAETVARAEAYFKFLTAPRTV